MASSSSKMELLQICCVSRLPDGLTRRGDINLLMLGDPGTAKSQLLKFVERCSPIGVRICWNVFFFSLSLLKWLLA